MRLVPHGTWIGTLVAALLLAFSAHAQSPTNTQPIGWVRVGNVVSLTAGTTTSNVQLGWNTASPAVKPPPLAYVCNLGTINAYVDLGNSSVVATTSNGAIVVNGTCRLLALAGNSYLAGITASSSTTISIETGSGTPTAKNHGKPSPQLPTYLVYDSNGFILFNNNGKNACNSC